MKILHFPIVSFVLPRQKGLPALGSVARVYDWGVNKPATSRDASHIGLCLDCKYARQIEAKETSLYFLCERSLTDPTFPKYPRLPVRRCPGYVKDSRGTVHKIR